MKYSLRSLMIAVLVLPPLLAWGALPLYRWLTTPKVPAPTVTIQTRWVRRCHAARGRENTHCDDAQDSDAPMKFTIRDLFLVTVIVALVLGWWVDHVRQSQIIEDLEPLSYGFDGGGNVLTSPKPDSLKHFPKRLPNSSAPATNQPKKTKNQPCPDNEP